MDPDRLLILWLVYTSKVSDKKTLKSNKLLIKVSLDIFKLDETFIMFEDNRSIELGTKILYDLLCTYFPFKKIWEKCSTLWRTEREERRIPNYTICPFGKT